MSVNMNKKIIEEDLIHHFSFPWQQLWINIDELISELNELKNDGWTEILYCRFKCDREITKRRKRLETDEEYNERLKTEEKQRKLSEARANRIRENRRKQYEKLKKEFET